MCRVGAGTTGSDARGHASQGTPQVGSNPGLQGWDSPQVMMSAPSKATAGRWEHGHPAAPGPRPHSRQQACVPRSHHGASGACASDLSPELSSHQFPLGGKTVILPDGVVVLSFPGVANVLFTTDKKGIHSFR